MASEDKNRAKPNKAFQAEAKAAQSVASIKYAPSKLGLMTDNMKTTAAGVKDLKTGDWLLRLDNAHPGANTPHININPKITGVKDPHFSVPSGVLKSGEVATKAVQVAGKVALVAAVAIDTYRISDAIYQDCTKTKKKRPGKRSAKVASSIAGGWGGGMLGAWVGNSSGAAIGGAIGSLFGGVGAVPGAIIGAVIGTIGGGVGGGLVGSAGAEAIVDETVSSDLEEEEEEEDSESKKNIKKKAK